MNGSVHSIRVPWAVPRALVPSACLLAIVVTWCVTPLNARAGDTDRRPDERAPITTEGDQRGGGCPCNADLSGSFECDVPNGVVDFIDIVHIVDCVEAQADPCGGPLDVCDVNCDGVVDHCDTGAVIEAFRLMPDPCSVPCGACCSEGGPDCVKTTLASCEWVFAGVYLGDGLPCIPNPCGECCGDPGAGDCFSPHPNPCCDDFVCCDMVCSIDSFCCFVEWDPICADVALQVCGGDTGSCCLPGACADEVVPGVPMTQPDCDAMGGIFVPGVLCIDNPCPECDVDADCDDGDLCTVDFCVGGTCFNDPIPGCGELVPCCLENGSCIDGMDPKQCASLGSAVDACPPDGTCIPPGIDCWQTGCGDTQYSFQKNPIPADFFGPGSLPFAGIVHFQGAGSGGDTQVARLAAAAPPIGGSDTVPIELTALSLVGCESITVTFDGGDTSQYDVEVELSPTPAPIGQMTITKTYENGGTFRSEFHVQPKFTFTKVGDPGDVAVLDTADAGKPPFTLNTTGVSHWVHDTGGVVSGLCGPFNNFAPGVRQNPQTLNMCCTPTGHAGPGHLHVTGQICTPCPEGACCNTASGTCTLVHDPADCKGEYMGDGTDCRDEDGDGIADWFETNNCNDPNRNHCFTGTDPNNPDTDGDGWTDGYELKKTKCDPCVFDFDNDGDGYPDTCGHYLKWSQPPGFEGEDEPSNIDWADDDPNVVIADDFVSDGRPITAVRWWGSNIPKKHGEDKEGFPVLPGVDLWRTPAGTDTYEDYSQNPIPADFFDPGSNPFTDTVYFEGVPLNSFPSLGATDTIVERLATADIATCPGSAIKIPIQIVALSLRAIVPITVTYPGGQPPQLWDVRVFLSDAPQQQGFMTIRQQSFGGGTYSSVLPVSAKLVFTRQSNGDVRVFDAGLAGISPNEFNASGTWVYQAPPGFGTAIALPGTQIDTDGDNVLDAVLATGSSNFFPGFEPKGGTCKEPPTDYNKPPLTGEAARWAAHGINPPNEDVFLCCIKDCCCFPVLDPILECFDQGGFLVSNCGTECFFGKGLADEVRVIGARESDRWDDFSAEDIALGAESIVRTKPPVPSIETDGVREGPPVEDVEGPATLFAQATWEEMASFDPRSPELGGINKGPPLGSSFAGTIDDGTRIPPDTHGAVGRNHIVEILNSGLTIYDRGGGIVAPQITLQAFWAPLGIAAHQPASWPFDPKILYDQYVDRWVVTSDSNPNARTGVNANWMLVAISQTNTPTGGWNLYGIRADVGPDVGLWADYPGIGLDPNNVIITNNMFTIANPAVFVHSDAWVIDKAAMMAGAPLVLGGNYALFHDPCGTGAFTMQPCHTFGQTAAVAVNHLIDEGWVDLATRTRRFVRVKDISGVGAGAVLNCRGGNDYVEVAGYNFCQADASQPLCSIDIETNDTRLLNAVCWKDRIWTTHSVGAGAPFDGQCDTVTLRTKTEVSWYEISPGAAGVFPGGVPNQQGRVDDPSLAYYFPSIAVNKDECVALGFSGSDDGTFVSGYYTVHDPAINGAGVTMPVNLLKAGVDSYWKQFGGSRNRWGDYSATVLDPIDLHTFWTVQEYAEVQYNSPPFPTPDFCRLDDGRWGTWWGSFQCENAIDGWFISFHEQLHPGTTASSGWMETSGSKRIGTEVVQRPEGADPLWLQSDPTPVGTARFDKTRVPADYQWDDGVSEIGIGVNDGATGNAFGWANRFTNLSGSAITLTEIEIAFGQPGGALGVVVGDAVDGVVWVDAAATGNMVNATLMVQWAIPGGVHSDDGATFATHTIPGGVSVPAGADFYVGLGDVQSLDGVMRFPAALDQTSSVVMSWAFFDAANIWDPVNLGAQTIGTIDSFGFPGNWLIRANVLTAVGEPLALYYCDVKVVDILHTQIPDCQGHQVYDYFVNLDQCCLVHANPDSRSGWIPAMKNAFYEEKCFDYFLDIQAVVGHQFHQDKETGECIEYTTGKGATNDFWGWHSTEFECGVTWGLQPALQTSVSMGPAGEWLYGPWDPVTPKCSPPNMAFELYTDDPIGGVDNNGDCVPDQCPPKACVVASPPTDKPTPVPIDIGFGTKNRYVSFEAGDPGRNQAVKVDFVSLPPPHSFANGRWLWVQQPVQVTEASCCNASTPPPTMWAATLGCTPFYTDWSVFGTVHVYDDGIIPSGVYDVRVQDDTCDCNDQALYSTPLTVNLSAAGDVVGNCGVVPCSAPEGVVNFVDISAVVDKFRNLPNAIRKARADVINSNVTLAAPDQKIDFVDISCIVEAFRGAACPMVGPPPAPRCVAKCGP